jgi:hypothetical protein
MEQFMRMTPRQAIDAGLGDGDWREGWMGDDGHESSPGFPDLTIGFRKRVPSKPAPAEDEDEEVTIARAEREKAANDPVIQDLARRLGVPVHFLLDFRERAIGQFGPRLDRTADEQES